MSPAPKRRGLGRGLDALLSSLPEANAADAAAPETADRGGLLHLAPSEIQPNPEQPRRHFDEEALETLSESIKLHGLIHPVVVERGEDGYRLVAGERRLRAAQRAGLTAIPALLRPASESARDSLEAALVENLARSDLNPLEEAAAYLRLADAFGMSHEAIALRLGRSRPAVSNTIRLLALPASVQAAIAEGRLSAGHGRALLSAGEIDRQEQLAARALAEGWSVRETERQAQRDANPSPAQPGAAPAASLSPDDEALRRGLEQALGLPLSLQRRARGGRIVIDFHDDDELHSLYVAAGGPPL